MHTFSSVGVKSFFVRFVLASGSVRDYSWNTNIYNPTKSLSGAVTYVEQYALNPNPNYPPFPSDCTNFISQILHEGGGFPEERGNWLYWQNWYYDGPDYWQCANSWTVVDTFYSYMKDYKGIVDKSSEAGQVLWPAGYGTYIYPPLLQGSIIKYEFPGGILHNAFVLTRGADSVNQALFDGPQPLVNYHTTNRKHINWTLISTKMQWVDTLLTNNRVKWDY